MNTSVTDAMNEASAALVVGRNGPRDPVTIRRNDLRLLVDRVSEESESDAVLAAITRAREALEGKP